jgi:threo-3-hydroxy-L-aspartate ammonia-lyase
VEGAPGSARPEPATTKKPMTEPDLETQLLPTLASVREASDRLRGVANRTPVLRSRTLDGLVGSAVLLKAESFQRGGAFKFRGAYNAISRLDEAERSAGVLTFSSGNHAQAVALVGGILGVRTTVVMPRSAPVAKREATRGYGAEIVLHDPATERREAVAERLRKESGMTLIPPYDHPDVVAGQGTAALELLDEVGPLDLILAPCGGGGLLAGTALAAGSVDGCRVVGVEPELADDATRSFHSGVLQRVQDPPTIADGLRTPSLGRYTWPIVRERVADMVTVSEEEIVEAMRFLWERMKVVVEPSGAVALAALMHREELRGHARVGVLVSGGNVDLTLAGTLFGREPSRQ